METPKTTWTWKNYTEPSPKNLKRWGAGLMALGGTVSGSSLVGSITSEEKNLTLLWVSLVSLTITGIGHFVLEFFKDDE